MVILIDYLRSEGKFSVISVDIATESLRHADLALRSVVRDMATMFLVNGLLTLESFASYREFVGADFCVYPLPSDREFSFLEAIRDYYRREGYAIYEIKFKDHENIIIPSFKARSSDGRLVDVNITYIVEEQRGHVTVLNLE